MHVGVPAEVKNHEYRVAITPAGVTELVRGGHRVTVQAGAGLGAAIADAEYLAAGAALGTVEEAWGAELVLKVKEPIESEYPRFRDGLVLFTYLHLAAEPELTHALTATGVTAIAYETVQLPNRALPLLAPMSEVAGRLAPIVGANAMLKPGGGPGLLVPGVPGTHPAEIVIIGAGVAGTNAMNVSVGLGAAVFLEFNGLLWTIGRSTLADLRRTEQSVSALAWLGILGLFFSGAFLEPNLADPLTVIKMTAVLVVAMNGVAMTRLTADLARLPMTIPFRRVPRRVQLWCVWSAVVSQVGWWTAVIIGMLNTAS